jgi:hypothetical protein
MTPRNTVRQPPHGPGVQTVQGLQPTHNARQIDSCPLTQNCLPRRRHTARRSRRCAKFCPSMQKFVVICGSSIGWAASETVQRTDHGRSAVRTAEMAKLYSCTSTSMWSRILWEGVTDVSRALWRDRRCQPRAAGRRPGILSDAKASDVDSMRAGRRT